MIKRIQIKNFKAIKDSEGMLIPPFTAFIGNNGTGKSSVMEAMQALQLSVTKDLMVAFRRFGGLEKVHNYRGKLDEPQETEAGYKKSTEGIFFHVYCSFDGDHIEYNLQLNTNETGDYYVIEAESLFHNTKHVFDGKIINNRGVTSYYMFSPEGEVDRRVEIVHPKTLLSLGIVDGLPKNQSEPIKKMYDFIASWQFLHLNPHTMGEPVLRNRLEKDIPLDYDGRNIADYLLWLKNQSQEYIDSLISKLQFVIPYLQDLQPDVLESKSDEVKLLMHENHAKGGNIPGWLLSSGTLRIAALLSMFDNPKPASVLFIDEIENGLDPRTIGFLMEEIRNAVQQENPMQVICTTHSPYLLDLIPLESIIVTERSENGSTFRFPDNEKELDGWKEKFSPGKLYTSGRLTK